MLEVRDLMRKSREESGGDALKMRGAVQTMEDMRKKEVHAVTMKVMEVHHAEEVVLEDTIRSVENIRYITCLTVSHLTTFIVTFIVIRCVITDVLCSNLMYCTTFCSCINVYLYAYDMLWVLILMRRNAMRVTLMYNMLCV